LKTGSSTSSPEHAWSIESCEAAHSGTSEEPASLSMSPNEPEYTHKSCIAPGSRSLCAYSQQNRFFQYYYSLPTHHTCKMVDIPPLSYTLLTPANIALGLLCSVGDVFVHRDRFSPPGCVYTCNVLTPRVGLSVLDHMDNLQSLSPPSLRIPRPKTLGPHSPAVDLDQSPRRHRLDHPRLPRTVRASDSHCTR
jgi:hypothetical protein